MEKIVVIVLLLLFGLVAVAMSFSTNSKHNQKVVVVHSGDLLYRKIERRDLVFFENEFEFNRDVDQIGYNIGDLLNMPFLSNQLNQDPVHGDFRRFDRMITIGNICKGSIMDIYISSRPVGEPVPDIERIRQSVESYIETNQNMLQKLLDTVQQHDVLTVHVRSGDAGSDDMFINVIRKLSHKYRQVIILAGIHLDIRTNENKKYTDIEIFITNINTILALNDNIYAVPHSPDTHLSLMKKASNLLVHQGGFSALGAIVAEGNVYITGHFVHAHTDRWKTCVDTKLISIPY